jgi:flavin reductase (DIM6/NTAB) family NADH-FMN oxidoreductase RutF
MNLQMADAFRLMPYGIYALVTKRDAEPCAMVVSWVSQVSYSPPLLMIALRRNRYALPAIQKSGVFSLSLLRVEHKPLVDHLKNQISRRRFSDLFGETEKKSAPRLKEALASWECHVRSSLEVGDHILLIGEVRSASANPPGEPLTTPAYGKTYIGQF